MDTAFAEFLWTFRISHFAKPDISHFAFRETGHFMGSFRPSIILSAAPDTLRESVWRRTAVVSWGYTEKRHILGRGYSEKRHILDRVLVEAA